MTSEIRVWEKKTMSDPFQVKTTLEPHLFVQVDSVNYLFQTNWVCGILCLLYSTYLGYGIFKLIPMILQIIAYLHALNIWASKELSIN